MVKLVKPMRGRSAPETVRLPACYANESLASAAATAAQRRMMSVSQYIRSSLLEAVTRDGIEMVVNTGVSHRR
jgi:hypothetical protein